MSAGKFRVVRMAHTTSACNVRCAHDVFRLFHPRIRGADKGLNSDNANDTFCEDGIAA